MITLRTATQAFHKLSLRGQTRNRHYAQLSHPMLNIEQPIVRQAPSKSEGWTIPALLVLLGLSCSTFSTHQLVSHNSSIKRSSSSSPGKK